MFPLFGTKYDDGELALLVERALTNDPLANPAELAPSIRNGVVTLSGPVANKVVRERIVSNVRASLDAAGVDYKRVDDNLTVHGAV